MAPLPPASRTPGQVVPTRRRALRATAWVLCALLLTYAGAQAAARRACEDGALRARIADLLAARIGPVELGPDVRVDRLFRVRFGPLTIPGASPSDPPFLRVEAVRVRPDLLRSLRAGHAVLTTVALDRVRIELPTRAADLATLARRVPHRSAPRSGPAAPVTTAALPQLQLHDLAVAFTVGPRRAVARAPRATVRPALAGDGSLSVDATLDLPGGGQAAAGLRREGERWRATARLDALAPAAVPDGLGAASSAWSDGTLSARLDGTYAPAARSARAQLELAAHGMVVGGSVLGPAPVGPLDLGFDGEVAWDGAARRLTLAHGRVLLPGDAPVALAADLGLAPGLPLSLHASADQLDFLALTAGLPPPLALPGDAPRPTGTFDAHVAVTGPLAEPAAWQLDAGLDLSRMRKEARRAPPVALLGSFVHHAEVDDGPPRAVLVGPARPDYVPIGELPGYVLRAVTTCEDAGFFGHQGFDFAELKNAAVEGAQAGHVVRGGSTITQQLAKNLYLTREKTLVRKLREALLTVALEATVPKQRLLEIYLNVAEWGPGVYGIGAAAHHWFGKDARDLTPREAAFLATVIPNPVRYHYMWTRGWLSDHWEERVDGLLRTMAAQGVLTEEQLSASLGQPLTFARCAAGPERADAKATCRGT